MGSFFSKSKSFDAQMIGDLSGKVTIVTGGNSGIGYHTVLELVAHGASRVYMASRSAERASVAIKRIEVDLAKRNMRLGENGVGQVIFIQCDLGTPASARASAEDFLTKESRLDVLINNAGGLAKKFELTSAGISDVMQTNHLGPFVYTTTLLPLLKKTATDSKADVRIINVGSEIANIMLPDGLRFDTIADYNNSFGSESFMSEQKRYACSKLGNMLFTTELQRRLDEEDTGIIVLCVHPGLVKSEGAVQMILDQNLFFKIAIILATGWRSVSSADGALTSLFAATSPLVRAKPTVYKGSYLMPYGNVAKMTQGSDTSRAMALWRVSEEILAQAK